MLISRTWGSYFFLSAILSSVELVPDAAFEADHCGTCRACLDACPTGAFVEPRVLDATKCISYLTIENRDAPPTELRSATSDWIFGCDVCQEVCPWNRKATPASDSVFQASEELRWLNLERILAMTSESFRAEFRKTPLWRARLEGLQRNALMAMTNQRDPQAASWARKYLQHSDAQLRIVAAWSLAELAAIDQVDYLAACRAQEPLQSVQTEMELALTKLMSHHAGENE